MQRLHLLYREGGTVCEKVKMHRGPVLPVFPFDSTVEIVARRLEKEPHGKL